MKKIALVFLLLVSITRAFSNNSSDSIGVRNIGGTQFVIHEVRSNETLYSLMKRYNCTDDEVFSANPELNSSSRIYVSQVLKFPTRIGTTHSKTAASDTNLPIVYASSKHKVRRGETLYAISKKYSVSLSEIKSWNGLRGSTIHVGQNLVVGKTIKPQSTSTVTTPYVAPARNVVASELPTPSVIELPPESETVTRFVVPNAPIGQQFQEIGIAQVISTDNATFKHLALHKTAPYGTLLMVTNEANNSHVMVKVIGTLPETGENSDVLVRLSPSAFQKLKPRDKRLRAKVTYTLAPITSR